MRKIRIILDLQERVKKLEYQLDNLNFILGVTIDNRLRFGLYEPNFLEKIRELQILSGVISPNYKGENEENVRIKEKSK